MFSLCKHRLLTTAVKSKSKSVRAESNRANSFSRAFPSSKSLPLTYFSSWFCPFAHRATIALEHHHIEYEWVEALGWEKQKPTGDEEFDAKERKDWFYHHKSPALLSANPLGMIPTIQSHDKKDVVTESLVCVEFADEIGGGAYPTLLSRNPWHAARERVAAMNVNKQVTSNYYAVLVRTDLEERAAAFDKLVAGLRVFASELENEGFWGGRGTLGFVDVALFPYAWRLYVLEHFRGFNVPRSGEMGLWENYHSWLLRVSALDYVHSTLPDKNKYLKHVAKYANDQARSKVGNATRRGVSALDYDDDIDAENAHDNQCNE